MDAYHLFSPVFFLHYSAFLLVLIFIIPTSYCDYPNYETCKQHFNCGLLENLSYPFWAGIDQPWFCGHEGFELKCEEGQYPLFGSEEQAFRVRKVNLSSYWLILVREDYNRSGICLQKLLLNTTLDGTPFQYTFQDGLENISIFYQCDPGIMGNVLHNFSCPNTPGNGFYATEDYLKKIRTLDLTQCKVRVEIPATEAVIHELDVSSLAAEVALMEAIEEGFNVTYDWYDEKAFKNCSLCVASGGKCATGLDTSNILCLIRRKNRQPKLIIGVLVGVTSLLIPCFIFYLYRRNSSMKNGIEENVKDIEGFITNYGLPALKRYSFGDIKKMTSSFKDKLGEGGYGTVYKGKLIDGRPVAVKVLNVSAANGEEFINEVATISRTSHVNVVTLLGYCLEVRKRVLIYEFMPNGSLEKFIHGRNASELKMHLEWQKLYEIAIGVARGLEYLHRGCNTRIVHFDIKPHNILLDDDFCPKISDFGLAKPSKRKESILSLSEARGTIGYIAPEVFSRHFGRVSPKSDVYSYGMMMLDMVGGRRKDYPEANDTSESTYFPQRIYKQLELGKFEVLGSISTDDINIVKKLALVGLWCIQTMPSNRPSMTKVIEMLEGSVAALEIPPMPFLSSPTTRSPANSSTIEKSINHGERSASINYEERSSINHGE